MNENNPVAVGDTSRSHIAVGDASRSHIAVGDASYSNHATMPKWQCAVSSLL